MPVPMADLPSVAIGDSHSLLVPTSLFPPIVIPKPMDTPNLVLILPSIASALRIALLSPILCASLWLCDHMTSASNPQCSTPLFCILQFPAYRSSSSRHRISSNPLSISISVCDSSLSKLPLELSSLHVVVLEKSSSLH